MNSAAIIEFTAFLLTLALKQLTIANQQGELTPEQELEFKAALKLKLDADYMQVEPDPTE
jgi:autotransporter translocation and assembly factor TamB